MRQIYGIIAFEKARFFYSACGPFLKHCERVKKFRETGNLKHLYKNGLDKPCSTHNAACSDCKDLTKRTISDQILRNRAYEIVRKRRYDG